MARQLGSHAPVAAWHLGILALMKSSDCPNPSELRSEITRWRTLAPSGTEGNIIRARIDALLAGSVV